jgi:hypothetical protein
MTLPPKVDALVKDALNELFFHCRGFVNDESYNKVVGGILRELVRKALQEFAGDPNRPASK